jgi:uncharacterized protein YycO
VGYPVYMVLTETISQLFVVVAEQKKVKKEKKKSKTKDGKGDKKKVKRSIKPAIVCADAGDA